MIKACKEKGLCVLGNNRCQRGPLQKRLSRVNKLCWQCTVVLADLYLELDLGLLVNSVLTGDGGGEYDLK